MNRIKTISLRPDSSSWRHFSQPHKSPLPHRSSDTRRFASDQSGQRCRCHAMEAHYVGNRDASSQLESDLRASQD